MDDNGPQVEEGNYTRIHNDILERLALGKFTSYEHKCLWFLFRETYGYQAKDKQISLSLWQIGTGIEKRNLNRTLAKLVDRRIIYRKGAHGRGNITVYGFNKYFEFWDEKVCEDTPNEKVCEDTPIIPEKVCERTPEKVCERTPTKERKKELLTTSAAEPVNSTKTVARMYESILGRMVDSPYRGEQLAELADTYPVEWIEEAFKTTMDTADKPSLKYATAILVRWEREGKPTSNDTVSETVTISIMGDGDNKW